MLLMFTNAPRGYLIQQDTQGMSITVDIWVTIFCQLTVCSPNLILTYIIINLQAGKLRAQKQVCA